MIFGTSEHFSDNNSVADRIVACIFAGDMARRDPDKLCGAICTENRIARTTAIFRA
jgi:hypothetical protein